MFIMYSLTNKSLPETAFFAITIKFLTKTSVVFIAVKALFKNINFKY